MELLITVAYIFLVRLIFFDFKLIRFSLFWKFIVFGLWISAALTEILFLGQYTPYSKDAFVQAYVVEMAPEYGGLVKEVYISPNLPIKKGAPLFQMDPEPWKSRVEELEAQLALAGTNVEVLKQNIVEAKARVAQTMANLEGARAKYTMISQAVKKNAVSRIHLEEIQQRVGALEAQLRANKAAQRSTQLAFDSEVGETHTEIAEVLAKLAKARYNLEHTTIRAPSNGYVSNLQLYPGAFTRLKNPIMSFINNEKHWILATMDQRGIQWVRKGNHAEIAFDMYPGRVFPAEVECVVWANGRSQGVPSGRLPLEQPQGGFDFFVRLRMTETDPNCPMRFGAKGLVAIHTDKAPDFLILIRQIEIRSESFLNFLFNPFR
jgi:multidrug resistance efflux pump